MINREAAKRAAIKLLERHASILEECDRLAYDAELNPSHAEENFSRIEELEKEAHAIELIFS